MRIFYRKRFIYRLTLYNGIEHQFLRLHRVSGADLTAEIAAILPDYKVD